MIEGSSPGSGSIPLTIVSGSGSWMSKNTWIRIRIRIRTVLQPPPGNSTFSSTFSFVQEITLWRKGERVRKLPLGGSLYQQQQHALARHQPGEQPVRTAPTPSLPPTPCLIDTAESRLPGAAAAEPKAEEAAAGEVETKRRFFTKLRIRRIRYPMLFLPQGPDPEYGTFLITGHPGSRIPDRTSDPWA